MFCHKCGNKSPQDSGFCNACGTKLAANDTAPQPLATYPYATPSNPDEVESPPTELVLKNSSVTAQEAQNVQQIPATNTTASSNKSLVQIAKACRFIGGAVLALVAIGSIFGFMIAPPAVAILGGLLILAGEVIIELFNRRFVKLVLTSIVFITICIVVVVALNHARNDGTTPTASVTAGNRYVQMVRDGSPVTWPNVTYGEAFNNFFRSPRWSHFKSDDGHQIVEFTGDMEYDGTLVTALLQFVIDERNGTFEAAFLSFSEAPQTQVMLWTVINTVFGESGGVQQRENIQVTFGSTFEYLGLEIILADSWVTDDELWQGRLKIPVAITNISSADASLMSISATAWAPDGLSLGIAFGEFGVDALTLIRPGATLETFLIFQDEGDGIYEIEFAEFLGASNAVDVLITLPIIRDLSAQQTPPAASGTDPNVRAGLVDHSFTLGGTPFVISMPPNWFYEMDWDGPGAVFLVGDVPSGRIVMYVSEIWWASSIDEVALMGNRINDFEFIDGHNGLRITEHHTDGTIQYWVRDDMWLYIEWFQEPDLLDYFELITDIAASLRRP